MLLSSLTKTQLLLNKLVDAEAAAGEMQAAERIADRSAQMTPLFDLWPYNVYVAPLQIAVKADFDFVPLCTRTVEFYCAQSCTTEKCAAAYRFERAR